MAILCVNSGQGSSSPIGVKPLPGLDLVDATFLGRSPFNWQSGQPPQNGDDVIINDGDEHNKVSVTYNLDQLQLNSLFSTEHLKLGDGMLTLNEGNLLDLTLDGGNLTFSESLVLNGKTELYTGIIDGNDRIVTNRGQFSILDFGVELDNLTFVNENEFSWDIYQLK